jgi:hypothetical protein
MSFFIFLISRKNRVSNIPSSQSSSFLIITHHANHIYARII